MIIAEFRRFKTTCNFLIVFAITGMLIFSGCDADETTGPQTPQIMAIGIFPDSVSIPVGEELEFEAFALTATGDTVDTSDLDIEWHWWSTDPEVFTVEPGGLATGLDPGEAFCMIETSIEVADIFNGKPETLIVRSGAQQSPGAQFQTVHLELSAGDQKISAFENIALKNRLRFTGRDSAFVMVF